MGDDNYADSQNPAPVYADKTSKTPATPAQKAQVPKVRIIIFVLSSVTTKNVEVLVKNQILFAKTLWKPKDDDLKQFEVDLTWDETIKTVDDKEKKYRRIEFLTQTGAPKALELVKQNYSNPKFEPEVPVFFCETAWDQQKEPGEPRDGLLGGFTLTKSLQWFSGERAIFVFASSARLRTLAHEMVHWIGISHLPYREDLNNLAAEGATGLQLDRDQFRRLYRWATQKDYRKQLATK